eukprot:Colp12_sorted_trinity150504_noHs@35384
MLFRLRSALAAFPRNGVFRFMSTEKKAYPGEMKMISSLQEGSVVKVFLNRPEKRNAVNIKLIEELSELTMWLSAQPHVRCVAIFGKGPSFCAGRDLKESRDHSFEQGLAFMADMAHVTSDWKKLPMPTIAGIQGGCFGFGLELALACDIRIGTASSKFCLPETGLGIFPGAGGAVWLKQVVPVGIAKEMLYTAKVIDGVEAERIGLCNSIVEESRLEDHTCKLAHTIAANSPLGIRAAKRVMDATMCMEEEEALAMSLNERLELNSTKDFQNALLAHELKQPKVFIGE